MTSDTKPGKTIVKRTQPELVEVNGKQVISSNRWNDDKIAEYVMLNGHEWLTVGDLAKCAWRHSDKATKDRARRYIHKIYQIILRHGHVLVYDYDGKRIERVKLLDNNSAVERQAAAYKAEQLRKRLKLSAEQYEQALKLIGPELPPANLSAVISTTSATNL